MAISQSRDKRNQKFLQELLVLFSQDDGCVTQSLAKLTVNFQSSLSICDSASEAANNTGNAGDSCNLQQYCDTGCQTDIMGEVGGSAAEDVSMCRPQQTSSNHCRIQMLHYALAAEMTSLCSPHIAGIFCDIIPASHASHYPLFVSRVFQYGPQDSSHLLDKVKVNWQYEEAKKK